MTELENPSKFRRRKQETRCRMGCKKNYCKCDPVPCTVAQVNIINCWHYSEPFIMLMRIKTISNIFNTDFIVIILLKKKWLPPMIATIR